jgi:hypothetical protein
MVMVEIFAEQWMRKFMDEWNKETELASELLNLNFNSTIAYGFAQDENPRGILVIKNGQAISGTAFDKQPCNWDLRASKESWQKWLSKPPGMMALGMAYTARELKSFAVMARV